MKQTPLRLAMWSGPRNISTAMMRSWGNRPDTTVCDEPLYAHYLYATGREHRGADEVIAAGPVEAPVAIERLLGPIPGGKGIFYQKHMTHHLLPHLDREWLRGLTHAFLIRDPREVLTSLMKHLPDLTLADTGFPQQVEIFRRVRDWTGQVPPVVDAHDVLNDPERILGLLCQSVGVDFDRRMLSWAPGLRDTDGVWARHWYKEVETTTGFRPYTPKNEPVPDRLTGILESCQVCYAELHAHRLGR